MAKAKKSSGTKKSSGRAINVTIPDRNGGNNDEIIFPKDPHAWTENMQKTANVTDYTPLIINTLAHGCGGCSVGFFPEYSVSSWSELESRKAFGFVARLTTLKRLYKALFGTKPEDPGSDLHPICLEASMDIPSYRKEDGNPIFFLPSEPHTWLIALEEERERRGVIQLTIKHEPNGGCVIAFLPRCLRRKRDTLHALQTGQGFGFIIDPNTLRHLRKFLGLAISFYRR